MRRHVTWPIFLCDIRVMSRHSANLKPKTVSISIFVISGSGDFFNSSLHETHKKCSKPETICWKNAVWTGCSYIQESRGKCCPLAGDECWKEVGAIWSRVVIVCYRQLNTNTSFIAFLCKLQILIYLISNYLFKSSIIREQPVQF